jgi:GH25 family lysozyme M1 (1,4-beta-N-acetylmuramidase)
MKSYFAPQRCLSVGRVVAALLVVALGLPGAPAQATGSVAHLAPQAPIAGPLPVGQPLGPATGCADPGALEGVDVSSYQSSINWAQVAQTKAFAYTRVADGAAYLDPTFVGNYTAIKSAGLKAGAYFFFEPAQDPGLQADHFVNQLVKAGLASGDLLPMFVVETSGGQTSQVISANLQTAIDDVYSALAERPGIATGSTIWDGQLGLTDTASFAGYPLWVEQWTNACPTPPADWSNWVLWQYSDLGHVTGITGTVDLDRSNGASLPVFTGTVTLRVRLPLVLGSP